MPNAKSIGWAIYAAGFAIWCFGYLSAGHAPAFDWDVATPSWISSFVPNRAGLRTRRLRQPAIAGQFPIYEHML